MRVTLERRKYAGLKAVLLGAALLILAFAGTVHAQEADWDDPDYVKMMNRAEEEEEAVDSNQASSSSDANPYTGNTYTHASSLASADIVYGVDVSKWQADIDWEGVKADGIDFAIIRIGYSTISSGTLSEDPYFEQNLKEAKAAGVAVGVYYFSQATTLAEAKAEANYTLELLGDTTLTCPVVFDWETASGYRNENVSGSKATSICQTFCDIVEAAGYTSMIYANYTDLTTWLDADTLAASYKIWIARYNTTTWTAKETSDWDYSWIYSYWQYSSSGQVDGISGNADVNFYYDTTYGIVDSSLVDTVTGVKVKSNSSTSELTISFTALDDVVGYEIWRSSSYDGTYKKIKTLKGTTSYTNTGRTEGREYYYKVRAYITVDGVKVYGKFSSIAYAYTAKSNSYKVVTTKADAHVRLHAGSYKTLVTVAKGTALSVQAITSDADGVRWYRVKTTVDGETVSGYINSKYATVKVKQVTSVKASKVTAKTITLSWAAQGGVTGYLIYRSDSRNGTYKKVGKVSAGTTTWKDSGLNTYTRYYYKIRAYSRVNGTNTYGSYSSIATLGTTKTNYKAKTTSAVTLRQYAGASYTKLTTIPKGKAVRVYYRTKDKSGKTWYYVRVTLNGKVYKGYVSGSYIKKT